MNPTLPLLLADFLQWDALSSNRAGLITLTGLSAVFAGLTILCLSMMLLKRIFAVREAPAPAATTPPSSSESVDAASDSPLRHAKPLANAPSQGVRLSVLAAATVALDQYDSGHLALGQSSHVKVRGAAHEVVVVAAGYPDRVRVDGEEVTVLRSRVATESSDVNG